MNGGPNAEVIKKVNALPVAKYSIKYKKENGQISEYTISQPIEKDDSKITAYAFGKGIRSFKVERILALK
jgi:hypothetical protein